MAQTAVEWLIKQINGQSFNKVIIDIPKKVIEQAIAMEKEQIIDAWNNCLCVQDFNNKCAEYYYNETYIDENNK